MEPAQGNEGQSGSSRKNWPTIGLIAAVAFAALVGVYLMTRGNPDQDKLTKTSNSAIVRAAPGHEKLCASSATYDLIKRELFRRAAQVRGSDEAAFDRLSSVAVVRMDHPVMESEDNSTSAVNCSGSLSLDLPPGVVVVGGRSTLSSDVDYTVTTAADGSGPAVVLRNADALVTPLATLSQVSVPSPATPEQTVQTNGSVEQPGVAVVQQQPASPLPPPVARMQPRPQSTRPSFDCSSARTKGEAAVCNDAGLAALDRAMAAQYSRAYALASPEERQILRETAQRFYAYRDRCPTSACVGDAYSGRMQEIRDIMEGRWQPAQ